MLYTKEQKKNLKERIEHFRAQGMNYTQMVAPLNKEGFKTTLGKPLTNYNVAQFASYHITKKGKRRAKARTAKRRKLPVDRSHLAVKEGSHTDRSALFNLVLHSRLPAEQKVSMLKALES